MTAFRLVRRLLEADCTIKSLLKLEMLACTEQQSAKLDAALDDGL